MRSGIEKEYNVTTNFWDDYEQEVQEQAGGGIICMAKIDLVWKTFPGEVNQELTLFPAPPCNKNSPAAVKAADKKAQLAAKAFGDEHGAERDPSKGLCIRAYRDNAARRGQPVTWKGDRFFFQAGWTEAGKQVGKSVRDTGIIQLPWEGYIRIGFFDNPYHVSLGEDGKREKDLDGNFRFPQVAYIVEAFADENAAREAIGVASAPGASAAGSYTLSQTAQDARWTLATLEEVWHEEISEKLNVPAPLVEKARAQVMKDYTITEADIDYALGQFIPY